MYPQNVCFDHTCVSNPSAAVATVFCEVGFVNASLRDDALRVLQVLSDHSLQKQRFVVIHCVWILPPLMRRRIMATLYLRNRGCMVSNFFSLLTLAGTFLQLRGIYCLLVLIPSTDIHLYVALQSAPIIEFFVAVLASAACRRSSAVQACNQLVPYLLELGHV